MVRILILFFLFISLNVKAQLIDIIGNLSIQGAETQGSVQSVGQGMSVLQKIKILQDIQQISIEVQTGYFGNYHNLSKNSLSQDYLKQVNWNIGPKNNGFYIQLNQINSDLCYYLIQNQISSSQLQVNENNNKICNNLNNIIYYFE